MMKPAMMKSSAIAPLPATIITTAVNAALAEDLGLVGDLTTNATVPVDAAALVAIATRRTGVVSGLEVAATAFLALDPDIDFEGHVADGDMIPAGTRIATIRGNTRAILSAERVALNFMGRMSGIATLTRAYVDAVADTGTEIADTRKTTPGLRAFEKYAVRCGGGINHRTGLFDAILIKDNHIAAAGGIEAALEAAAEAAGHMVKIEIEIDTLDQLRQVDFALADCILLDNMSLDDLREAVAFIDQRTLIEASGGVDLDTVRSIAQTGVDLISVGALTHSAPVLDLGLDFET